MVASEVVRQFRGPKYRADGVLFGGFVAAHTTETPDYERWEAWKYRRMRYGLGFLVGGFLFQILGVWVK